MNHIVKIVASGEILSAVVELEHAVGPEIVQVGPAVVEAEQVEADEPAHRRQHDRDEGNQTVLQQDGIALEKETMIPHYIFIHGERY